MSRCQTREIFFLYTVVEKSFRCSRREKIGSLGNISLASQLQMVCEAKSFISLLFHRETWCHYFFFLGTHGRVFFVSLDQVGNWLYLITLCFIWKSTCIYVHKGCIMASAGLSLFWCMQKCLAKGIFFNEEILCFFPEDLCFLFAVLSVCLDNCEEVEFSLPANVLFLLLNQKLVYCAMGWSLFGKSQNCLISLSDIVTTLERF